MNFLLLLSSYIIFFEIVICLIINTISAYFIRNILQLIPFPLAGYYGFKHLDVYEVSRAPIVDVALILFSKNLKKNSSVFFNLSQTFRDKKKVMRE